MSAQKAVPTIECAVLAACRIFILLRLSGLTVGAAYSTTCKRGAGWRRRRRVIVTPHEPQLHAKLHQTFYKSNSITLHHEINVIRTLLLPRYRCDLPRFLHISMAEQSNLETSYIPTTRTQASYRQIPYKGTNIVINIRNDDGSTGKGILIGMLSAFGSAGFVALIFAIIYFFKYTSRGRIILDRVGRPGQYDDEQAYAREEAEALEVMDDLQRAEYLRAKGTKGN